MEGFRRRDELERDIASAGQTGEDIAEAISLDELMDAKQDTAHALGTSYTQENKKEEKMAELREVLNEFTKLQGVDAVCLVGRDGFVLDRIAKTGIDTDMIGAIASSGFGSAESMGKQLGKGMMAISMIEYERGPVLFSPVGDDAFVVIVADREANLGMIRLKLKKHSQELQLAAAI